MKNKRVKNEIRTVGELKEILNNFDDSMLLNFGTSLHGFGLSGYGFDRLSVSLLSDDLEEYLEKYSME